MATQLPEPLQPAAAWLPANPLAEARALLVGFSREQPESDQGWYLPSLAVTDAARQVDCLQRVVRLNQNHSAARERLAEPQAQSGAPAARSVTAPQQTSEPGRPPAATVQPTIPAQPPPEPPARPDHAQVLRSQLASNSATVAPAPAARPVGAAERCPDRWSA